MTAHKNRPKGHRRALFLILTIVMITGLAAIWGLRPREDVYRSFSSPDGHYRVVVVARRSRFPAMMPGQSGDAPGRVRLYWNEHMLRETPTEMVSLIEDVEWETGQVSIKALGTWNLPHATK